MPSPSLFKVAFTHGLISLRPNPPSSKGSQRQATAHGGYPPPAALNPGFGDNYTFYTGDGSPAHNWPAIDQWIDFYSMWEANESMMNSSCTVFGTGIPNDTPAEAEDILDAIAKESGETGVDKRFILAVIMQESKGCVRVKSTVSPGAAIRNPGLMQTHNGKGTCNEAGSISTPCPADAIQQMVKDGTAGTHDGDGLKQTLASAQGSGATKYYQAARAYNSGSVDPSGDLGKGCCTHCYASDIANRLTGWVSAKTSCELDSALW